jgi:hypothetical protein
VSPAAGPACLADPRCRSAAWLTWAAVLVSLLWLGAWPRVSGPTLALAAVLTAAVAAPAVAARAWRPALAPRPVGAAGALLLLGAAALTGTLASWLAALAVPALAIGPGLLLVRVSLPGPAPALVIVALGLAALSLAGLVALATGTFTPWLFVALSAAAWAGLGVTGWRRPALAASVESPSGASRSAMTMIGFLGGLTALLLLRAGVPDCCFDPVWYHLPLAAAIAEGRHRVIPDLWWTMAPLGYHVLAALAYALGGGMAAKLLHTVFLFLTVGLGVGLGSRLQSPLAGLVAAGLFLTVPVVMWAGTAGNADLGAAFFGVAAVAAFVEFLLVGGPGWLLVAGALLGAATAIKAFAATLLLPVGAILLVERNRPARGRGVLLLAAGMAVTAGPWVGRALALTGNPVFPAFAASTYAEGLHGGGALTGAYPWTLGRVLAFPLTLTFRASELAEVPAGAMGTYPLLWLPLLVAGWSRLQRVERSLLAIAGGHLVAIALFAPSPRFLLVPWLLLAVVLGSVVVRRPGSSSASRHLPLAPPPHRPGGGGAASRASVTRVLAPVILLAGLAYSLVAWLGFFPGGPSVDYLVGRIDRSEFLRRTVPGFDAFEPVRRLVPPEEPILVDGLHATWHVRRYLLPAFLPGVRPLLRTPDLSRAEAGARLRALGTRYLLAPATARYRLLELGLATPVVSAAGFTLYALAPP